MIGRREISESASSVPNNSVRPRLNPFLLLLPHPLPHSLPMHSVLLAQLSRARNLSWHEKRCLVIPGIVSRPPPRSSSCVGFRWRNRAPAEPVCLSRVEKRAEGREGSDCTAEHGTARRGTARCSGRWGRITCHSLGCGRPPRPGNHQVEGRLGSHSGQTHSSQSRQRQ